MPSLAQYAYEQLERYSREARYDCPSSGRLERLNLLSEEALEVVLEGLVKVLGVTL